VRRDRATIFLDLDGPVLECRDRHYACYVELCSRYGRKPRAPEGYWRLRRRRVSAVDLLMAGGVREDEAELRRSWIDLIEQPRYLSLDVPQPGAAEAVAAWKAAGHRLIVATLRRDARAARAQLERLRLTVLLERFVVCDPELGSIGKAAAARHEARGADPQDCTWIGDTEVDAEAAVVLGCSNLYLVSCGIRNARYLRSLGAGEVVRDLAALGALQTFRTIERSATRQP
jgi:phosphoglycolate phosphatase